MIDTDKNRFHDCATCHRKDIDNEESDEDDCCTYCGAYFCYKCYTNGVKGTTVFSGDFSMKQKWDKVGECCIRQAMSEGFIPECGIEEAMKASEQE